MEDFYGGTEDRIKDDTDEVMHGGKVASQIEAQ